MNFWKYLHDLNDPKYFVFLLQVSIFELFQKFFQKKKLELIQNIFTFWIFFWKTFLNFFKTILLFCLKDWLSSVIFTIWLHKVSGRRGTTTTTEQNPAAFCSLLFNLLKFDFISCYSCGWCCFRLPRFSLATVLFLEWSTMKFYLFSFAYDWWLSYVMLTYEKISHHKSSKRMASHFP